MGEVYRARDSRLDRDVAIKVIQARWPAKRLQNEARAAAQVTHPNVVAIYDVGESNGTPYIVTELVPGGTLSDAITRGPIPVDKAAALARAIAEGLAEAHRKGIVHRDLKPDNILLTQSGTPKIADFGLSKLLAPPESDANQSTTLVGGAAHDASIAGTPAYMSPEQAAGRPTDFRSDQFSFAVMVIEMITGGRIFQRGSTAQSIAAVIECDTKDALKAIPSSDLVRILQRCLEREASDRYGSTDDLVHDLRHVGRNRRRSIGWIAATLVVVAAMVFIPRHRETATTKPTITSLAILPLANFSGDRTQDYFADAMTEELTSQVAAVRSVRVISRTSANAYRGTTKPLSAIARELGVDAVIEGSVVRAGNRARITVQLIDAATDRHLWSRSFERSESDILSLQRDVAGEIVQQIRATLAPAERAELKRLPTTNAEAYDAYLHGEYAVSVSISNRKSADDALRYAELAAKLDPDFADAWVLVARACQAILFNWEGGRDLDEKGMIAIEKALAINPGLAEAYHARGQMQYNALHNFDIASAIRDYRRAAALNPNLAGAHHSLCSELNHLGLYDEAVVECKTALRLDPKLEGARIRLGRAFWQSNRFAEALDVYDRYALIHHEKFITLAYLGRRGDAQAGIDAGLNGVYMKTNAKDRDADLIAAGALVDAMAGKPVDGKARRAFEINGTAAHFHHAAFALASAYGELGDAKTAVHWLAVASKTGMPNYPLFRENPSMRKLHGNAEYEAFMKELRPRWEELVRQSPATPHS